MWRITKLADLEKLFEEGDAGDIVVIVDARTRVTRRYVIEAGIGGVLRFVEQE
jgi:hypothetical protein